MDNRTYRDESESIKRVFYTLKVIVLDKVESLHMYKNIFGKHVIEVRTISGETTKINSDSETGALEKFNTIKSHFKHILIE